LVLLGGAPSPATPPVVEDDAGALFVVPRVSGGTDLAGVRAAVPSVAEPPSVAEWVAGGTVVVAATPVNVAGRGALVPGRGSARGVVDGAVVVVVAAGAVVPGGLGLGFDRAPTEPVVLDDELGPPVLVGAGSTSREGPVELVLEEATEVLGAMVVEVAVAELAGPLLGGPLTVVVVLGAGGGRVVELAVVSGGAVVEGGLVVVVDGTVVEVPESPGTLDVLDVLVGAVVGALVEAEAGAVVGAGAVVVDAAPGLSVVLVELVEVEEPALSADAGMVATQDKASQRAQTGNRRRKRSPLAQRATTPRAPVRDGKLTRYTPVE
jgi:hypothetical protein